MIRKRDFIFLIIIPIIGGLIGKSIDKYIADLPSDLPDNVPRGGGMKKELLELLIKHKKNIPYICAIVSALGVGSAVTVDEQFYELLMGATFTIPKIPESNKYISKLG